MRGMIGFRRAGAVFSALLWAAAYAAFAQQPAQSAFSDRPVDRINPLLAGQMDTAATKVNDQIYLAPGFGNTYMIVTSEGCVIVDTSLAPFAPRHKKMLRELSGAPVKYIILTHGHGDHTGGVRLWKEAGTQVIAQSNHVEFMNHQTRLAGFYAKRNSAQFAINVPLQEASPGNRAAKIDATVLFDKEHEFKLGGLTFKLMATPGETPDHLTVWIPELKAVFVGDNYYESFPNMYTLRGTPARPALDYADSLDKAIALGPELLLPSHGAPVKGAAEIKARLTKYRDAIMYVHDATVRGMNEGKDVFTLMKEIKLPKELEVGEGYGNLIWSVRGIYEGYIGWFNGDPADMYEVPPKDVYPEIVKMAGGAEPVAARAAEMVAAGNVKEGLQMANMALAADAKNATALKARAAGLEKLLEAAKNSNERGWLEYGVRETKARLESK